MAPNVEIVARVIPDGFGKDKNGNATLRVSLALMPDLRDLKGETAVEIEDWPKQIWDVRSKLKLFIAGDPNTHTPKELEWYARGQLDQPNPAAGPQDKPSSLEFNEDRAKAANALWNRFFLADCADAQFDALRAALQESQVRPQLMKTARGTASSIEGEPLSYPVAPLVKGVEALYGSQAAATLLATAGQLPVDGERASWDAARSIVSPRFFETLNTDLFGVFTPDTLTYRLSAAKNNGRWRDTLKGEGTPSNVTEQVMLVGQALERSASPTKLANGADSPDPRMNYITAQFVHHYGEFFADEQRYHLKVAQYALDLDRSIKQKLAGFRATVTPDFPAVENKGEAEPKVDRYFASMATDLAPWTGGRFSGGPAELGMHEDERRHLQLKAQTERALDRVKLQRAVAAYHAAWRPDTPASTANAPAAQPRDERIEIARRKFLSILSRPSLAKFLGFIIDLELPLSSLGDQKDKCFLLMADFGDGLPKPRRVWTATKLIPPKDGDDGFFGPCTKLDFALTLQVSIKNLPKDTPPVYEGGVLNLAAPGNDGDPRFILTDFDVDAAVQGLENTAHSRTTTRGKGALDGEIKVALPNLRTRGIALIDRDRTKEVVREIAIASTKGVSLMGDSEPVTLYAEDLVVGYRLDVGLCRKDETGVPPADRWRTLTDRRVSYDAKDFTIGIKSETVKKWIREWLQHDLERENGFVKPITRQVTNNSLKGGNVTQYVPQETVAVWTGGSLAVGTGERPPLVAEKDKDETDEAFRKRVWELPDKDDQLHPITSIDSYRELGTNLAFALAPKADKGGGLPPLRFGRRYWMGARLVYINGGGIPLSTAVRHCYTREAKTTAVGGQKEGEGFLFSRGERAGAPVLLLPLNDPLLASKPGELRGDGTATVVLRGASAEGTRYLVPPRSVFDLAEAHGEFDRYVGWQRPPGAFDSYERDFASGEFSNARTIRRKGATVENNEPKGGDNPGQVLKPGQSKNAVPYYPDPLARECHVRILQHGETGGDERECWTLGFYEKASGSIQEARPLRIRVRNFKPKPGEPLHKVTLHKAENPPTLLIELGDAADLDLLMWSGTDNEEGLLALRPAAYAWSTLAALPLWLKSQLEGDLSLKGLGPGIAAALSNAIGFLEKPAAIRVAEMATGAKPLVELLRKQCGPVPTFADQRRLRVVRPVKAPLMPPRLKKADLNCGTGVRAAQDTLVPVRVLPRPQEVDADGTARLPDSWSAYVAKQGSTDPLCYPSEIGASQTFFVGTALVHRASTGKVRFQATWNEFKDEVTRLPDGTFAYVPARGSPGIFSIERFLRDAKGDLTEVDLLRDDAKALRGLKIDFSDTKARRLTFSLFGISRFTEFYEPPKVSGGLLEGSAEFKKGGTPPDSFEAHDPKYDVTLWVPSTARPAAPVLDRILPVFRWQTDYAKDKIMVKREVDLRVYLKRPWHSSGEGERLAVICWPPNLFDDATADEVARCTLLDRKAPDAINPKEEFLTRWGADPIHLSGDLSDLIPADQFASAELRVSNLVLRLPHRDSEFTGGEPQLQIEEGCPNDPPDPTATLKRDKVGTNGVAVAVAAYAPKLDPERGDAWYCDLPISPGESYLPFIRLGLARYQPQTIPGENLELSYPIAEWAQIPPKREAVIEFLDSRTILVIVSGIGYHQSQSDELPHERHILDRPRLRIRVGRAVRHDRMPEHEDEISYLPVIVGGKPLDYPKLVPTISGNTVVWIQKITLPQTSGQRSYAVIIEETEVMVADGDVIGDVVSAERGPMFACTIPFTVPHGTGSVPKAHPQGEGVELVPAES